VDFSRYSRIIPEEHHAGLERGLRSVPDFGWLLSAPHQSQDRLQGDLLADFPTVFLDNKEQARTHRFTVLVLNNTCDLPDRRLDFVTVAPVLNFEHYVHFEKRRRPLVSVEGYASDLRRNRISELFYLPPFDGFSGGGVALLHLACSVSSEVYQTAVASRKRVASFTQVGFYYFLMKVTTHLTRPESDEVVRTAAD
jgi:hypothetical protein